MISFVLYFHSSRTDNLKQTLRFLFKRENCIGEVLLICNDFTNDKFNNCDLYNLNLENYEKPKMCNFGVNKCKFEIVALLDSDRIFPNNYFGNIERTIKRKQFFCSKNMLKLKKDYSDEEIASGNFKYDLEEKSLGWEIRKKNLFSGSTVFFKEDYLEAGGMDESFKWYGFADNDMTLNVLSKKYEPIWKEDFEIHLWHPTQVFQNKKLVGLNQLRKKSQNNLLKFLKKWNLFADHKKEYKCFFL